MMSRKDYRNFAERLARVRPEAEDRDGRKAWAEAVASVAWVLAEDNPRFDRHRFYAAADPEEVAP